MELNTRIDVLREILESSGACYGSGETSSFFTNESEAVQVAQMICGTCPVDARAACLEYALSTNMEYGVWGGILFWDGQGLLPEEAPGASPGRRGSPAGGSFEGGPVVPGGRTVAHEEDRLILRS